MSDIVFTIAQEQAYKWNENPLIVLAGPGSGKTAVLTERIVRLLRESPEENFKILALTFTNKAAGEMNERISKLIPTMGKRLFVGTFHGFCAEILRNHGSAIGVSPNFAIYSEAADQEAIIEDLKKKYLAKFDDDTVQSLKLHNAIQYFQKHLCYTDTEITMKMPSTQYAEIFKWFTIEYYEKLKKLNALDFDSIVLLTHQLLKNNPMIAKIYRIAFKYICIDEFQDTNFAQYELIKILAGGKHKNIFIVADDDQVIYGWNGASYKRITEFKEEFKAEIIQLFENFRCPTSVVKIANTLIKNNASRTSGKVPLEAMRLDSENSEVALKSFDKHSNEIEWVKDDIEEIRATSSNVSIGVIARNNKLLEIQYSIIKDAGISVKKSKRKDDFENPYVRWILMILKLANKRNDERILASLINTLRIITEQNIDIEKVLLFAKTYDDDLLRALVDELQELKLDINIFNSIGNNLLERNNYLKFVEDAFIWSDTMVDQKAEAFGQYNGEEFKEQYNEEKKVWYSIFNNMKYNFETQSITLSTFLQEFSMTSKEPEPSTDDVQCLTVHASKGKEFDYVYLIGMVEDELPSFQSRKKGNSSVEMEEERRNCFVAITRTKKKLTITYADSYYGWSKQPSRFLYEMGLLD